MDSKEIKLVFHKRLIPQGFRCFPTKRIYFKDFKFYFIIVEIQPYYGDGFFVNVGVQFLWDPPGVYSYSKGDARLIGPDIMGSVLFDSPKVNENIEDMFRQIEALVVEYEKLQDLRVLLDCLINRNDFKAIANKGYKDHDPDLGIIKILLNDWSGRDLLEKDSVQSPQAKLLVDCGYDKQLFEEQLLKLINENREANGKRARLKLPLLSSIEEITNF